MHFGECVQIATSCFVGITKSEFITWEEAKIVYWCMLFLPCLLFYFPKSYFTLSLFSLISFSTLCVACLSRSTFLLWALFLFIQDQAYVISLYYPHCLPTIFFCNEHSSKIPTTILAIWIQPPLHLGMPSIFSLFHYPSQDKFISIRFYCIPFPLFWWVKPQVSLYLSLQHALSSLCQFATYFG